MLDLSKVQFLNIWNDDKERITHVYFRFDTETALTFLKEKNDNRYKESLSKIGVKNPNMVIPIFDLDMYCPYGECVEDVGCVDFIAKIKHDNNNPELKIKYENYIEILFTQSLIPEIDFSTKEICKLWSEAFMKQKEEEMEI